MSKQVKLIDCSLRDGHQSLLATRMSTEQCLRVLPLLKDSGYQVLELWGGATLDSAIRFTGDCPFERLEKFRSVLGKGIQIRSLCRGQNLFGYTPYADNVVFSFVKEAVKTGNDRIRIFDALNDSRNLVTATMTTKTFNGKVEAAMSYTTSPVHDLAHFLNFATQAMDNGADCLAIKDMAGLLHPADCLAMVEAIRKKFGDVELTLHSHCTNGLAVTSYLVAMLAGVDYLDTGHGPMAGSTSQPPVELILYFAKEMGFKVDLDTKAFPEIDKRLRQIRVELKSQDANPDKFGDPWPADPPEWMRPLIKQAAKLIAAKDKDSLNKAIEIIEDQILVKMGYPPVDRSQLDAQVPGGMISNLHSQLKQQGKLDQMPAVLAEIPRVRMESGYPPLVTPTSQIVGSQAVFNVITGTRYGMITQEFKNLVLGKYGRNPGPVDPDLVKKCAPDGKVFSDRPATYAPKFEPDKIPADVRPLLTDNRALLLYLLFPQPAKAFLEKRKK